LTKDIEISFVKESFVKTQLLFRRSNPVFMNQFCPIIFESQKENLIQSLDCWDNIFSFLVPKELFKLLSVDRNMNDLIIKSNVWEDLYRRDFKNKGLYELEKELIKKSKSNWFSVYKIKLFQKFFCEPILFHCLEDYISVGLANEGVKFKEPMVYCEEEYFDSYSQSLVSYMLWGSSCRKNKSTPIVKEGKINTTEIERYIESLYEKFFPFYENLRQMRYFSSYFHTIKPVSSVYPVIFLEWEGMTKIEKSVLKKVFLKFDAPSLKFITKHQAILAKHSKENGIVVFLTRESIRIVMDLNKSILKEISMKDTSDGVQKMKTFIKPMAELFKQHGIIFYSTFEELQDEFLKSFKDEFNVKVSESDDVWDGMVIYSQFSNTFTNAPCELINVENLAKETKNYSNFNFSQNSILNFEKFNSDGRSPIHIAGYYGNLEFIKLAESLGVDLNLKEKNFGQNILHISCAAGKMNVVEYLMNKVKMDPKVKDKDNLTCFQLSKLKMIKDFIQEYESNN
jgi:hypothetical protein